MNRQLHDGHAGVFIANDLQKDENTKQRLQKFKMFFAGLAFATLSFIGTHPIQTKLFFLKMLELFSLLFLLISGIILLVRLAEHKVIDANVEKIPCKLVRLYYKYTYVKNSSYWVSFIFGMISMILSRSILIFLT